MKYNINDIVEIIDESAFYYGALGRIDKIYTDDETDDEYEYFVIFEMIDEETGEESIYEVSYIIQMYLFYHLHQEIVPYLCLYKIL